MRVVTLFSAVAFAVIATSGPALAFAKIKKIAVAPGYMLVKNDSGNARPFPNCSSSPTCITETVKVLLGRNGTAILDLPCHQLGGCKIVGRQ
jgi:hypothetical protein